MATETNEDLQNRERELKERAKEPTITHETIPGEKPIHPGRRGIADDGKTTNSTTDEDTN